MNNSTLVDPTCPNLTWYDQAGEKMAFVVYSVLSPIYITLALFGRCLCLKAFYTKSKKESAYMYQIFTTISETVEVIAWGLFIFIVDWLAGLKLEGQRWYRSCYTCMKFAAIIPSALVFFTIMMSQLFTICMSADRLYALWKPNSYRVSNFKRNQILSVLFCITVSISVSIYQCFAVSVTIAKNGTQDDPALYKLSYEPAYPDITQLFTLLHNSVQTVGLVLLYFLNIALLYFFRIRRVKGAKTLNLTNEQKTREEGERTLLLLTVCQCICMTLSVTNQVCFLILAFFFPTFYSCITPFYDPFGDAIHECVDLCDLLSIFMISKQFRRMIREQLPFWTRSNVVSAQARSQDIRTQDY